MERGSDDDGHSESNPMLQSAPDPHGLEGRWKIDH